MVQHGWHILNQNLWVSTHDAQFNESLNMMTVKRQNKLGDTVSGVVKPEV